MNMTPARAPDLVSADMVPCGFRVDAPAPVASVSPGYEGAGPVGGFALIVACHEHGRKP